MNTPNFEQIKENVTAMAAYKWEIETPFALVEHYKTYEEKDVALVMECAGLSKEEAVEFLNEMVKRSVDAWYAEQPPLISLPQ